MARASVASHCVQMADTHAIGGEIDSVHAGRELAGKEMLISMRPGAIGPGAVSVAVSCSGWSVMLQRLGRAAAVQRCVVQR